MLRNMEGYSVPEQGRTSVPDIFPIIPMRLQVYVKCVFLRKYEKDSEDQYLGLRSAQPRIFRVLYIDEAIWNPKLSKR